MRELTDNEKRAGLRFPKEVLDAAFDKVKNPNDWKGPIDTVLDFEPSHDLAEELNIIQDAVEFHTATQADLSGVPDSDRVRIRVRAKGYRMGPAGDH